MTKIVFTSLSAIVFLLITSTTFAEEKSESKKIKVACVGDSITYGAKMKNRSKNHYPRLLGSLLGENYAVANFGRNGATLLSKGSRPWSKLAHCQKAMTFEPDIVIVNLGANDTQDRNIGQYPDDFIPDYLALIEKFRALPSKPTVYICNPVEVFSNDGGIKFDVMEKEIRPRIKTVAERSKCKVIDLKTPFVNRKDLMADNVHPNEGGAKLMAEIIAETIKKDHLEKAQQTREDKVLKTAPKQ